MKPGGAVIALALALAACGTVRTIPSNGALVPDWSLQLTPDLNVALDKIVYWGAYAGVAYLVLDPLTPNWEIEEAKFTDNRYHLAMRMKRYYAGGAGEARVVFNRRAAELVRAHGATSYQILEYSEGMESSVLGSRRVGAGVIELATAGAASQPLSAAPGAAP
jgi:hypothetical protein